jgi:Fe-S cluster assembly iron-binding protein IscA
MSVISAGNTASTAVVITGDTTGNIVFATGGANTVALTIANTQASTFSSNVSFSSQVAVAAAGIKFSDATVQTTAPSAAFASGTVMTFVQTAAPTGWTKSTTHDNKAIRIVSGTAGSGGNVAFTTAFANGSAGTYTLATADIPSHSHTTEIAGGSGTPQRFYASTWGGSDSYVPNIQGGGTGGGGSHTHSLALAVQYVDVIIASKD